MTNDKEEEIVADGEVLRVPLPVMDEAVMRAIKLTLSDYAARHKDGRVTMPTEGGATMAPAAARAYADWKVRLEQLWRGEPGFGTGNQKPAQEE